jgi:RNA polymerase sigma-70 factor (ECF subfamily)
MIFSYIYRYTGEYHVSCDITQEVFIKMMKYLSRFDNSLGSFKNWIFKIALNTSRDYFKSTSYKLNKNGEQIEENIPDSSPNVVDILNHMEQREEVKRAINELPDYQREALILKFYHDMKIKDIAKIMDSNESTIKSRLHQGIAKLKGLLLEVDVIEKSRY